MDPPRCRSLISVADVRARTGDEIFFRGLRSYCDPVHGFVQEIQDAGNDGHDSADDGRGSKTFYEVL